MLFCVPSGAIVRVRDRPFQEMMDQLRKANYLEMRVSTSLTSELRAILEKAVQKKRAQQARGLRVVWRGAKSKNKKNS